MNNCLVILRILNIIYFFTSYFELSNELKQYFLSYYLLITSFIELYSFINEYFKLENSSLIKVQIFLNFLRILSYPYLIYNFPPIFTYCGIYENYMACFSFNIISLTGTIIYSVFCSFGFYISILVLSHSYNEFNSFTSD